MLNYEVVIAEAVVKPRSDLENAGYLLVCSDRSCWEANVNDLSAVVYWQRGDRLQIECDDAAHWTATNMDRLNRAIDVKPLDHELRHVIQQGNK